MIEVLHGLGNRLVTLSTCMILKSPHTKVYWNKSWHCQSSFEDVVRIKNCPFRILSGQLEAPLLPRPVPENQLPTHFKAWNVFVKAANKYALKASAKRILPSVAVQRRVAEFFKTVPGGAKNCIGVHIRRGDVADKQEKLKSVDEYIRIVKSIKRPGQCIIVASDDDSILQRFRNVFGVGVFRAANKTDREASFEAAVDLFTLVRCNTFVPCPQSSFSQIIQWMR